MNYSVNNSLGEFLYRCLTLEQASRWKEKNAAKWTRLGMKEPNGIEICYNGKPVKEQVTA